MPGRWCIGFALIFLTMAPTPAADPAETLSTVCRDWMIANMRDPLLQSQRNWGNQKEAKGRIIRRLEGKKLNDGFWQRVQVQALDPKETLAVAVHDLKQPEPGRSTFDIYLGQDVRITYDQQFWALGKRLYGGTTRARCRAALRVSCEVKSTLQTPPGNVLPVLVAQVRVTEADLNYTDLVVERTAGLDGPAAAKLGAVVQDVVRQMKPDLEKELLAKANAAIVKAAGTKEVRLALDQLVGLAKSPPKSMP